MSAVIKNLGFKLDVMILYSLRVEKQQNKFLRFVRLSLV